MLQTKLEKSKYIQSMPVTLRVISYVLISVFLLFFYFLSLRLLDVYGFPMLLVVLTIASLIGIEFFTVFFLVDMFLQNILIASVTTNSDPSTVFIFSLSLGTGFFITCLFAIYCAVNWLFVFRKILPPESRTLLKWTLLFSCIAVVYSGLGLAASDAKSVVTYLRVYLGAVMFLIIGIGTGYKVSLEFLGAVFRVIAGILVVWGISELFFAKELLGFFNVLEYTRMKYLGLRPAVESLDSIVSPKSYLNLSGQFGLDIKLPHIAGPHIHAISYGYELAFCTLVCFMFNYRFLVAGCIAVLLLVGAKGAIVEALAALSFCALYCTVRRPRVLLSCLAIYIMAYVSLVSYYGIVSRDFHMLGLIGSINGFMANPVGRGVGVGGNMSTEGFKESTMDKFQNYQHTGAAAIALESGFGVMLYQLGVATVIFLVFYYLIIRDIWDKVIADGTDKRKIILPLALVLLLVNSLFQEEAFSPASLGLWLFFGGFFLANTWREEVAESIMPSSQKAAFKRE